MTTHDAYSIGNIDIRTRPQGSRCSFDYRERISPSFDNDDLRIGVTINEETVFSLHSNQFHTYWKQHESSVHYPERIRGMRRTYLHCSDQIFDEMEACNVPGALHACALYHQNDFHNSAQHCSFLQIHSNLLILDQTQMYYMKTEDHFQMTGSHHDNAYELSARDSILHVSYEIPLTLVAIEIFCFQSLL